MFTSAAYSAVHSNNSQPRYPEGRRRLKMSNLFFLRHWKRRCTADDSRSSVWCCRGRHQLPHTPLSTPDNTGTHWKGWSSVEYESSQRVTCGLPPAKPLFPEWWGHDETHGRILIETESQYHFSETKSGTQHLGSDIIIQGRSVIPRLSHARRALALTSWTTAHMAECQRCGPTRRSLPDSVHSIAVLSLRAATIDWSQANDLSVFPLFNPLFSLWSVRTTKWLVLSNLKNQRYPIWFWAFCRVGDNAITLLSNV